VGGFYAPSAEGERKEMAMILAENCLMRLMGARWELQWSYITPLYSVGAQIRHKSPLLTTSAIRRGLNSYGDTRMDEGEANCPVGSYFNARRNFSATVRRDLMREKYLSLASTSVQGESGVLVFSSISSAAVM
jgi:hypothetical protein